MDAQSALVFGNGSDRELRLNLLTPEREKSLCQRPRKFAPE